MTPHLERNSAVGSVAERSRHNSLLNPPVPEVAAEIEEDKADDVEII